MSDFAFLQNPLSKKWVILAPRRAKRPDEANGTEPVCPFCPGREAGDGEAVRVIPNKFPFAKEHEVVIHSPDHHKSFEDLPLAHVELILQTYRQRFRAHQENGQVYIFHNHGMVAGESLPHPHSQIAVVPNHVKMDIPRMDPLSILELGETPKSVTTEHFRVFCPLFSQWPDEVWIGPKQRGRSFGEITDAQVTDFAFVLQRAIQILGLRHGAEFPYNFYIYPGGDWYLRIIPRVKTLGGFEVGTGIFVNTQDPRETQAFLEEHFHTPNQEKIKTSHKADYSKHA